MNDDVNAADERAVAEVALFTDDVESAKALLRASSSARRPSPTGRAVRIFAAGGAKILVHERAGAH